MGVSEQVESRIQALCRQGDFNAATTVALEQYGPEVLGFLMRAVNDEAQASEVFSLVAEDVWRGIEGFGWRSTFRTWIYALSQRAIARYFRSRRQQPIGGVPLSQAPKARALADKVRSVTAPYLRTEIKDRFAALREQLSPEERMLLTLRHDRKMAWAQIAEVMADEEGLSEDALRRETDRCKKKYRRMLPRLKQLAAQEGLLDD